MSTKLFLWLCVISCLALLCAPLAAQNITGAITGRVVDPSGMVIPGASVALIETATGAEMVAVSNDEGRFEFPSVRPGEYDIKVEMTGFKTLVSSGHRVFATQRLAVNDFKLELGEVSQAITVSGRVEAVQTTSAERSALVDREMLENMATMSGDPYELVLQLPGFVTHEGAAAPIQAPQILREGTALGGRPNSKNFTLDGVAALNSMTNQAMAVSLNVHAVQEVQVQLSNFQAEYGRRAGPTINVITRGGSKDFHGSAYFYRRHEKLNANSFMNNKNGMPKQPYRYQTRGFTIGGPAYIPNLFNTSKDKLFFFFSFSQQPSEMPGGLAQYTMPTEPERMGDFSQTLDSKGNVVPIKDPLTGEPFPNNQIPINRINPAGQAILNFLPLPNWQDPDGKFNFNRQMLSYRTPSHEEMIKIDWVPSSNFTLSGRYAQDFNPIYTFAAPWLDVEQLTPRPGRNFMIRGNHNVSPTLIHEFTFGYNRLGNSTFPTNKEELAKLQRSTIGMDLGQFNPEGNPDNLLPNLAFGTLPNGGASPPLNLNFPDGLMQHFTFIDNISKVSGSHIFKFGAYIERGMNDHLQGGGNGSLNFAISTANPYESGHPYANALLGNFNTYSEPIGLAKNKMRYLNVEWYAQDTWRVNNRLTIDAGIRFYWMPPESELNDRMATFDPSRFDPSRAVRLYMPHKDPLSGQVVGRDPVTGETVANTFVGFIVPGSGDPYNGMVTAAEQKPFKDSGVVFGPRLGLAYDPFGDGKTAIRAGFGMYYERVSGNLMMNLTSNPLVVNTPTVYFGNLSTFLQSSGLMTPQNVNTFSRTGELPTTMNFSLGVQQRISDAFVLDVAYVGSVSRHLTDSFNWNTTPFATNFDPANENPTAPGKPLPVAFLRPFMGYQNISMTEFSGSSNYHSLQTLVTRRFGDRLNFNASWVWSRALTYAFFDNGARSFLLGSWRDYAPSDYNATHVFNLNFIYSLPEVNRYLGGNSVLGHVLDGWRLSGAGKIQTGKALGISLNAPGIDFTGSTEGARVNLVGNPILPRGERTFERFFNTNAVAMPKPGVFGVTTTADVDYGNAARIVLTGPGMHVWNLSLMKDFRLFESHRLQVIAEFYNAFNHPSYRALDTGARFNAAGEQTNPRFGEVLGTQAPRVIQLGARYMF